VVCTALHKIPYAIKLVKINHSEALFLNIIANQDLYFDIITNKPVIDFTFLFVYFLG